MGSKLSPREVVIYMCCKYQSNLDDILWALKQKEKVDDDLLKQYLSNIKSKVVTIVDEDYPKCFKSINKPPLALFYYGDLSILSNYKKVGIIGSRTASRYGEAITKQIVNELALKKEEVAIISGMAKGIDSISQIQAMENNMKVVSFLGSGIECIYPKSSSQIYEYCKTNNGLVCSEYCFDIPPKSEHFPLRNRVLAGASDIVCVIEGTTKSGTSITSNYALEFGKSVICVPNRVDSEFDLTNKLIQDGAYSYLSKDDMDYLLDKIVIKQ